jgi:adenosylcobinamide-GDP ribazoletransferase
MKRLAAAFGFLTVLPVPGSARVSSDTLAASATMFPVVGVVLAALIALLAWIVGMAFPPTVSAAIVVIAMWAISGGLHMDGLSDTADGFLSSRPPERILEIMKDSRIGAMGVVAIVAVFLVKATALSSMPTEIFWRSAALAILVGRCAMLVDMVVLPSASPESGLGAMFLSKRRPWEAILASVVACGGGYLLLGWGGLGAAGVAILVTILFGVQCCRRIGGATGDTIGASCELAETTVLLIASAYGFMQWSEGRWL